MNKRAVKRLKKAFDHNDNLARRFMRYQSYICKLLKKNRILSRKKIEIPARIEQQCVSRAECGSL